MPYSSDIIAKLRADQGIAVQEYAAFGQQYFFYLNESFLRLCDQQTFFILARHEFRFACAIFYRSPKLLGYRNAHPSREQIDAIKAKYQLDNEIYNAVVLPVIAAGDCSSLEPLITNPAIDVSLRQQFLLTAITLDKDKLWLRKFMRQGGNFFCLLFLNHHLKTAFVV